jgi:hypothetical protein
VTAADLAPGAWFAAGSRPSPLLHDMIRSDLSVQQVEGGDEAAARTTDDHLARTKYTSKLCRATAW